MCWGKAEQEFTSWKAVEVKDEDLKEGEFGDAPLEPVAEEEPAETREREKVLERV